MDFSEATSPGFSMCKNASNKPCFKWQVTSEFSEKERRVLQVCPYCAYKQPRLAQIKVHFFNHHVKLEREGNKQESRPPTPMEVEIEKKVEEPALKVSVQTEKQDSVEEQVTRTTYSSKSENVVVSTKNDLPLRDQDSEWIQVKRDKLSGNKKKKAQSSSKQQAEFFKKPPPARSVQLVEKKPKSKGKIVDVPPSPPPPKKSSLSKEKSSGDLFSSGDSFDAAVVQLLGKPSADNSDQSLEIQLLNEDEFDDSDEDKDLREILKRKPRSQVFIPGHSGLKSRSKIQKRQSF